MRCCVCDRLKAVCGVVRRCVDVENIFASQQYAFCYKNKFTIIQFNWNSEQTETRKCIKEVSTPKSAAHSWLNQCKAAMLQQT